MAVLCGRFLCRRHHFDAPRCLLAGTEIDMKSGVYKVRPDNRDKSHSRTFGAINPANFPDSFDTYSGLTCPDQNAMGMPNGCTGFTQSELCSDEDKCIYRPQFTYLKTQQIEGTAGQDVGCDIRDSLKSTLVYGVQLQGETDEQAFDHRRGSYYQVEPAPDYFDGIRSVLLRELSVSMASYWYDNFSNPDQFGIVTLPAANTPYSMHNYKVCGFVTIAGTPYLKVKPWLGPQFGINGFCYFPREVVNFLLNQTYTGAFVLDRFVKNAPNVAIYSTYEVILSYLYRIRDILIG